MLPKWAIPSILLFAGPQVQAGFVNSSLEQYNYQIGDALLEVASYDGFDEFEEVADLTGFSQYDFRVNGGAWETIPYSAEYDSYKRAHRYATLGEMLAARPESGTYEHRVTWDNATTSTVTLSGTRPAYATAIPIDPVFTINGVSGGTWGRNGGDFDAGVFAFDPGQFSDGQSFTVTLNTYAGYHLAAGQALVLAVADVRTAFVPLDEFNAINVPAFGETDDLSVPYSLTFTKGDGPIDAGDNDPLTFMFGDDARFELEGEHVNLLSLEDASAELGLPPDSAMKGFIYQTATGFIIQAATTPTLPADLDSDGDVDDADFGLAFAAFTGPNNGPSSNPLADLDNDGDVDDADFGLAFAAFTGPGQAAANVPEPGSFVAMSVIAVAGLVRRRRQGGSRCVTRGGRPCVGVALR